MEPGLHYRRRQNYHRAEILLVKITQSFEGREKGGGFYRIDRALESGVVDPLGIGMHRRRDPLNPLFKSSPPSTPAIYLSPSLTLSIYVESILVFLPAAY